MKTKRFGLLACSILLVALLAAYFYLKSNNAEGDAPKEDEFTQDETVAILDRQIGDVTRLTLTVGGSVIEFEPDSSDSDVPWRLSGYPGAKLDSYAISTLGQGVTQLTVDKKALDSTSALSEFGLEPAAATVRISYADGSVETLLLGRETPDGEYNYLMRDGDPAVYLLSTATSRKYFYTLEDIVDKSLPQITGEELQYAYIYNAEKEGDGVVELIATEQDEQSAEYGQISLEMLKPLEGNEVYLSDFVNNVMAGVNSMSFDRLVSMNTEDLAAYGLIEPTLELILRDAESMIHLLVGSEAGDGCFFAMLKGGYAVFTINGDILSDFRNVNILEFMSRFICLKSIDEVERVIITEASGMTEMKINMTELEPEDADSEPKKVYAPEVNGVEVDEQAFKDVYQLVISLSFDAEIATAVTDGNPELSIRFVMNDDTADTEVSYYPYNENFYAVSVDGGQTRFAINKQDVSYMLSRLNELKLR